jgi:hypothetical protein
VDQLIQWFGWVYTFFKDFQPMLTALVAGVAAWVAFVAPQQVARVNASAAREAQEREFEKARRDAAELVEARRCAFVAWFVVQCAEAVAEMERWERLLDIYEEKSNREQRERMELPDVTAMDSFGFTHSIAAMKKIIELPDITIAANYRPCRWECY